MGSGDRFYLMEMNNRPVVKGDIGSLIKIEGLVVGGGGKDKAILMLPDFQAPKGIYPPETKIVYMNAEEWSDFISRSDNPEILVGPAKIFQRKARYEISGTVQQKVWAEDGFKCLYCGAKMGERQMTIDHFIPLEMGGPNDTGNYVTACRRCNKDKGSQDPKEWLDPATYDRVVGYLARRTIV